MPDAVNNLALLLQAEGKIAEAHQFLDRAVELSRKFPDQPERTLTLMSNLGDLLGDLALYPQAEQMLREVVKRRRELLGNEHPQIPRAMMKLRWILAQ